jgi:hypothetical protein
VRALNDILLIAAVVAFAGAAIPLTLIRRKDFVDATADVITEAPEPPAAAPEMRLAA